MPLDGGVYGRCAHAGDAMTTADSLHRLRRTCARAQPASTLSRLFLSIGEPHASSKISYKRCVYCACNRIPVLVLFWCKSAKHDPRGDRGHRRRFERSRCRRGQRHAAQQWHERGVQTDRRRERVFQSAAGSTRHIHRHDQRCGIWNVQCDNSARHRWFADCSCIRN